MGQGSEESDLSLWTRIKRDDEPAFKTLFDKYYSRLCDYSILYTKDLSVAKEIVADVFLKVWQQRISLEVTTSLKAYLFASVRNHSLNYLNRQKLKVVSLDNYLENSNDGPQDGEKMLLFNELEHVVMNEINRLPERQKEIIKMSRMYGMGYREISKILSISVYTVQEHMVGAMKNLSERLKNYVLLK